MYYVVAIFFILCIFTLSAHLYEMGRTINELERRISSLNDDELITRYILASLLKSKRDEGDLLMELIEQFGLKNVQEFLGVLCQN